MYALYSISHGREDGYGTIEVYGPRKVNLPALWLDFCRAYGFDLIPPFEMGGGNLRKRVEREHDAIDRAQADGLSYGGDPAYQFVSWLEREHGFKQPTMVHFHADIDDALAG